MIIVKVGKNGNIEQALKRYKAKVFNTKQLEEIRNRQHYVKKSEKRRNEILKAKYNNKKSSED